MNFTKKKIVKKLNESQLSDKTIQNYITCSSIILRNYDDKALDDILDNPKFILNKCLEVSDSLSTQKNYLSAFVKIYKLFDMENNSKILSDKINNNNTELTRTQKFFNQTKPKKNLHVAKNMFADLIKTYHSLKLNVVDGDYDINAQLCAIAYIMFTYGVLRGDEFMSLYICDNESVNNYINVINIDTKKIIIRKHKTYRTTGTKIISVDDELIDIVKYGLYGPLITDYKTMKPFDTSKKLTRFIHKHLGEDIYTYRKALTSISLHSEDADYINKIAYNQGHSKDTQLDFYLDYA